MKKKRINPFRHTLILLTLLGTAAAFPYSYGAWVGMTGENTMALNPFLSGSYSPVSLGYDMAASFGLGKTADIFVSTGPWAMVRGDFSGGKNLGIVALYADPAKAGPEYHLFWDENKMFAGEVNIYFHKALAEKTMTIGGRLAPVVKLGPVISIYAEVDPAFEISGGAFTLGVVPGVCFNIGKTQLSVGFTVSDVLASEMNVGYGAWFWAPFEFKGESAPAAK